MNEGLGGKDGVVCGEGQGQGMGIGEAREVRKETEETGGNELERARKKGKEERTLMGLGKWHEWERFEKKEKH